MLIKKLRLKHCFYRTSKWRSGKKLKIKKIFAFINQIYIFINMYVEEDFLRTLHEKRSNFISLLPEFVSKEKCISLLNSDNIFQIYISI